jgi:hypothetical protein
LAGLAERGFDVEPLPDGDIQVTMQIDMVSGRAIGAHGPLHPYAKDHTDLARRITEKLMASLRTG